MGGLAINGLQEKDVDHRRAARQAVQRIAIALGPTFLSWMLRELRSRLNRGFMLPVGAAAALAAVQALAQDTERPLKPGDLDGAIEEIMSQVSVELDAVLDNTKSE